MAVKHGISLETLLRMRANNFKWCTGCKEWHDKNNFGKDSTRSDGLRTDCRDYIRTVRNKKPAYLESKRKSDKKHMSSIIAYKKAWREKNLERSRANVRTWIRTQRRSNPHYRYLSSASSRLRQIVLRQAATKHETSRKLLGCSKESFIKHIEGKFQPGMTWNNYGKGKDHWQIDHIKPCASFDLSKPEHQQACFHYTNLQPLWAVENRRKWHRLPSPDVP